MTPVIPNTLHKMMIAGSPGLKLVQTTSSIEVELGEYDRLAINRKWMSSEEAKPMLRWHKQLNLTPYPVHVWSEIDASSGFDGLMNLSVTARCGFEFEDSNHAMLFKLAFGGAA